MKKFLLYILILPFWGSQMSFAQTTWTQLGNDILGAAAANNAGNSVSLSADGTILVEGSPGAAAGGTLRGQARIFEYNNGIWTQKGSTLSGKHNGASFGYSVCANSDGSVIAIGEPYYTVGTKDNLGEIFIYQWNGNDWVPMGDTITGDTPFDYVGNAISLSSDGKTLAVGTSANGGGIIRGEVQIYRYNGSIWQALGNTIIGTVDYENFGLSVSLSSSGDTIAIGGPQFKSDSGRVQVYKLNGGTWDSLSTALTGDHETDYFGNSVSLSNNGKTLAIGAPQGFLFVETGYAKIFDWTGNSWVQRGNTITSAEDGDEFGYAVSLSGDGNSVVIGARNGNGYSSILQGRTHLYNWDGSKWVPAGDSLVGDHDYDLSGNSVSISDNGEIIAIGAPGNDNNGSESGKVSVHQFINCSSLKVDLGADTVVCDTSFTLDAGISGASYLWNTSEKSQNIKLNASGKYFVTVTKGVCKASDTIDVKLSWFNFDDVSSICEEKLTLDVGDGWTSIKWSTGAKTQTITTDSSGKYVVEVSNASCTMKDSTELIEYWNKLGNDLNGKNAIDHFGYHLEMGDANTIAIGAHANDDNGNSSGQVKIFSWNGTTWVQKGQDINGNPDDYLGYSIAMPDANTFATRATTSKGYAKVYTWNGSSWIQKGNDLTMKGLGELTMPDPNTIAISSSYAGANNEGAVQIYTWDGSSWVQKGEDIPGIYSTEFGEDIQMPDANTIAIGMPKFYDDYGAIDIYTWDRSKWTQKGNRFVGLKKGSYLGETLDMPTSNTIAFVQQDYPLDKIAVWEYIDGTWRGKEKIMTDFVSTIQMPSENIIAVGCSFKNKVEIYGWNGEEWKQKGSTLKGGTTSLEYGTDVFMPDPYTLAIGDMMDKDVAGSAGKVQIFSTNCDYPLVGIEDQNDELNYIESSLGYMLFPNPSNGIFKVKSINQSQIDRIEVYNMMGRRILSFNYSSATFDSEIDLSGQSKGIYLINIKGKSGDATYKMILK